eukprot:m.103092 g.103092  ORF g.103092 m.103092 type:complete len:471 (-) comp15707_c3_seq2:1374-2786(-)
MVAAVKDRVIGYRERLVQAREAALYEKQKKGDMTAVYKEHLERMSRLHTRLSWLILEIRPPVEQDSFADFESLPFVPTAEGHHLCAKATWRAAGSNTTDEVSILRADLKELKTAAYELYNCLWMASLTPGWQGARLMGPIVTDDHIYLVTGIGGRTLTEVLADNPSQSERQDICRRLMMALQKLQGVVPGTFLHRLLHLSSIQMSADKQILFGGPCTAATMDDMLYLHAAACEAMEAAVTASDKRTISKIPVMLYGALCWQICDAAADQRLFHGTLDRAEAAKALLKTGKEFPEAPTDSVQWEVIRQCLAMDGWGSFQDVLLQFGLMVTPKNKRKVRILCLDGGGTRGLIETRILERIEQMTGRKVGYLRIYLRWIWREIAKGKKQTTKRKKSVEVVARRGCRRLRQTRKTFSIFELSRLPSHCETSCSFLHLHLHYPHPFEDFYHASPFSIHCVTIFFDLNNSPDLRDV